MPRLVSVAAVLYLVAFAFVFALSVFPATAFAQFAQPNEPGYGAASQFGADSTRGFVPLANFNESSKLRDVYSTGAGVGDFSNFLNKLFFGAISLGGILAVLRLSWAGFRYMTSDLPGQKGHAKEIIGDTLLGLFLLLGIWLILNQINPHILDLNVTAPAAKEDNSSLLDKMPTDI